MARRARAPAGRARRPRAIEWRTALIVGTLLLLGGNGMVSIAELTIPSGIAAVIIATIPIWLCVFDAVLTRRMPSLLAIGGLLVGLVGVAILLLPSAGSDSLNPAGIGILVVAAIAWAAGSHYARRGPLPANQLLGTGMEQLAGGVLLLVVAAAVGEVGAFDPGTVTGASLLGLAFLIVFGSLAAFTAYVWLLNHVAVTTVATYAYVNPVVAVALGVAFHHEALSLRSLLAAALIIGAVVAMVSGRPREVEEAGPAPETASLEPDTPSPAPAPSSFTPSPHNSAPTSGAGPCPTLVPPSLPLPTSRRSTARRTSSRRRVERRRGRFRALARVVDLRRLPDPLEDVVAVALGVEEAGAGGQDHDVRVEPHVDERLAAERQVEDHALLRLLPPGLPVHVVAGAASTRLTPLARWRRNSRR